MDSDSQYEDSDEEMNLHSELPGVPLPAPPTALPYRAPTYLFPYLTHVFTPSQAHPVTPRRALSLNSITPGPGQYIDTNGAIRHLTPGTYGVPVGTPHTPGPAHPYHPYPPYYYSPAPAFPQTSLLSKDETTLRQKELEFALGIFDDVLADANAQDPTFWPRKGFLYGKALSTEEKLLVFIRCMRRLGFPTIGHLLSALFGGDYRKDATVRQTIAAFLGCKNADKTMFPTAIVDLMFTHARSQDANPPYFHLPRHSLPPSQRLLRELPVPMSNTSTKNGLISWALGVVVQYIDTSEVPRLLDQTHGLMRGHSSSIDWDVILEWNLLGKQEMIVRATPAIFALFTTIAVNRRTRLQLDVAAKATESDQRMDLDSDSDDSVVEDVPNTHFLRTPPDISRGVPPKTIHDPWMGITVSILVLLVFRHHHAIMFATIMGLFAFTTTANQDLIAILCRLGLSVAYSTIIKLLEDLAQHSAARLRLFGGLVEKGDPTFLFVFDNINKQHRAHDATISRRDEMKSGTAATLVELEDIPDGALRSEPLIRAFQEKRRGSLTVAKLFNDIDWDHIGGIGPATVLCVWIKHIPSLRRFRTEVEALFKETHAKRPLRLRKSGIHEMRTTDIEESTATGAADVLRNLVTQVAIKPEWLKDCLIFICGDQLTIDRIRKSKRYLAKADDPFERLEWALPLIQLWHMKWAWQKSIFRLHWHDDLGKNVFGLHHDVNTLRRGKFNLEKCDFYPAHHILEDRFEALICEALRVTCEEKIGTSRPVEETLLDGLEVVFADSGAMADCSFQDVLALASIVYMRYVDNAAFEDASGATEHDEEIYEPANHQEEEPELETDLGLASTSQTERPRKKKKSKKAPAAARNFSKGDQSLANTCAFLRVTFWYIEMNASITEGDIGRTFEIIKLLRFSFWGAGSTNYGNELLELACNFLTEFPAPLVEAVLNNYLVNPSGLPGHWLEGDLMQEHLNFWFKRLFNEKSHDFNSIHLSEHVGLSITGFGTLRERFPEWFDIKKNSETHTSASKVEDLNTLGIHYRQDKILIYMPGREQPFVVINEFESGHNILDGGKLQEFLVRTMKDGPGLPSEQDPGSNEYVYDPACPITSTDGVLNHDPFVLVPGGN